ncbi:MAG: trypsin-like peptidase domain-containing protein [Gemmatimonadales bacterium]
MSPTREWFKFGLLAAVAVVLAVVFTGMVSAAPGGLPRQEDFVALVNRPAPVQAVEQVQNLGEAFTAVAEAVRPTVVFIEGETPRPRVTERQHPNLPPPFDQFFEFPEPQRPQPRRGTGSGFIISPDGYIMTNNHVVENFDRFTVQLFDHREFRAEVVGRDPDTDVAVLKINGRNLPAVSFGDSDRLRVGEWVLAIGNPFGEQFSFTVTAGIVSGRGRGLQGLTNSQWFIQDFIQTDAAINPGNSGGPLVDIRGQVVGVNSAIASQSGVFEGYSFAIPINLARTVADQLIKEGKVTRAALGISIQSPDPLDAELVGLDKPTGVKIADFPTEDSPAKRAGLRRGDLVVEVDGEKIEYAGQLQTLVGFKRPGETVRVTVLRREDDEIKRLTIPVTLTEREIQGERVLAAGRTEEEGAAETSAEEKLGITVSTLDARSARALGEIGEGVYVEDVDPDGPAWNRLSAAVPRAGNFDIITHVNRRRVRTLKEFRTAVADLESGDIVSLTVTFVRGGQIAGSTVVRLRVKGAT